MFKGLLKRNMKAYMDDMMVKTKQLSNHIFYLNEVFKVIRMYKLILNPKNVCFVLVWVNS